MKRIQAPDRMLKAEEVGEKLGVSGQTVMRWAKEGINNFPAPYRLTSRLIRWSENAVHAWASQQPKNTSDNL